MENLTKRNTSLREEIEMYELMLRLEKNGAKKKIIKELLDKARKEESVELLR